MIRCYEKDGYPDRHKEKRAGRTLTKEKKNCETLLKFWEHIPVDAVTLAACDRYHEWRKKHILKGYAGKTLLELAEYRFQALITNLPASVDALTVWRRYNGRADLENRIRELGGQFGIKRLCVDNFWGTEALHHLASAAYNLCVLLQRRLGQLEKCELNTLRWRLFGRAAVGSRAGGKPTLKLAVHGAANRNWWREMLAKISALPNCHAVASLQA